MTVRWTVRPRHRSARRRANPLTQTKKMTGETPVIYAVAPQLLFLLYGFEGRVLNDSPVDCQTPPPLRPQAGKSSHTELFISYLKTYR